jgi:hypothetical protein
LLQHNNHHPSPFSILREKVSAMIMKNLNLMFSKLLRAGLVQIVTALILAFTLLLPAQAGTHTVEGHKVVVQAFTKSAKRECDKITYTFHVYLLTDGTPTNVIISDSWPNGLLPASAVTMNGNTSSGPFVNVNPTSWSAQFDTPVGTGPTVTSYTLSFTSTIDPAALNGGDFKMINQAKISIGKSDPAYERSDDPSVSGQEDKTILSIPAAEVKACMKPVDPPIKKSCLDGKAEVTCGKIYGTYNIIIKPTGVGGVMPTSVSITSLTPGVTLSPALASYPVIGGQVVVTVLGATPGQTVDFDVMGTTAGGGSVSGTNICCNGKISVTIPKDLNCPPPPSTVMIKKYCDPVVKGKDGVIPGGYTAICHIKVTTTGVINYPINIMEALTAPGKVKYLTSNPATDPWACAPSPVTAPAPMNCVLPANTMTSPSDTSIIDVLVTFPNKAAVNEATNCAGGNFNGERLKKSCTKFHEGDGKIDIKKTCEPLKASGHGYITRCKITVVTTGPVTYPLNVTEALSGSGIVGFYSSSPATVWTCNPFTASSGTPINCVANGGLNNTSSTSELEFDVGFPTAAAANESENCGIVKSPVQTDKKSCVKFPIDKSIKVEKTCGPVTYSKYAQGPAIDALGYHANCTITVTTAGPQSGPINVNDAMVGGNAYWMTSTSTPAWACSGTSCNINGGALNQTSSVSTFNVVVGFAGVGNVQEAKNCAEVTGAAQKSCVPFKINDGKLTVIKEAYVNGTHYTAQPFAAKVICGGNVVVASIQDGGAPYVQTGLPIGTSCTVDEGNNITAPAGFCKQGMIATWSPSYSPASPVVITAAGATVTVKNTLVCNPPPPVGTQTITKVCDPAVEVPGPVKSAYTSACHITVTTTGPQTGTLVVGENLTGNGTLGNASGPAPWTCSTSNCTVNSAQLNQTSSTSVIDVSVNFSDAGSVSEAQNCAKLSLNDAADGESCTKFTVVPPKKVDLEVVKTGPTDCKPNTPCPFTISVTSIGQPYNGNVLLYDVLTPNLAWPVTSIVPNVCGASITTMPFGCVANLNLAANVPFTFTVTLSPLTVNALTQNENCISAALVGSNVPVGPINAADIQQLGNSGQLATPKQSCWKFKVEPPVVDSKLYVKKVVVNNAPGSVAGLIFPITATCTHSPSTSALDNLTDGQTKPFYIYVAGSSCTVNEGAIPTTTACGNDTPVWTTTYAPAQTVALSPNGETVTVTNTLDCKPIDPPVSNPIKVKKVVINNAPAPVGDLQFPITVTCVKGNNGEVLDTDATHTVADGQTVDYLPYAAGFTCSAHEGTIPSTNACGKQTPVWTTSYATQPVAMTPAGETITVTNTLNCKKVIIDTPVCPPRTHFDAKSGKCVDDVVVCKSPLVRNPKTNTCNLPLPDCRPGTHLEGKVCVENAVRCKLPTVRNPDTNTCYVPRPKCFPPKIYNAATKSCVTPRPKCGPNEVYNAKRNICQPKRVECQRGTHLEGNKCVRDKAKEQQCQRGTINVRGRCVALPRCNFPEIPVPGTGLCINPFGGGGKRDQPRDQPKTDGGAIGVPGLF